MFKKKDNASALPVGLFLDHADLSPFRSPRLECCEPQVTGEKGSGQCWSRVNEGGQGGDDESRKTVDVEEGALTSVQKSESPCEIPFYPPRSRPGISSSLVALRSTFKPSGVDRPRGQDPVARTACPSDHGPDLYSTASSSQRVTWADAQCLARGFYSRPEAVTGW
ncbi:hypothetical protein RRG08_044183 [Elysia crispata]|uniref:Uncharacterized protein n=1 Tax=Elysia crispata TaxID=231223 RepID=A0AAE1CNE7_9GAST|nr:hypothetical protein RRG08_044183 [Elysia crispata]